MCFCPQGCCAAYRMEWWKRSICLRGAESGEESSPHFPVPHVSTCTVHARHAHWNHAAAGFSTGVGGQMPCNP
ncbi:MAG TPA: hypothetical protein DEF41_09175 [Desulfovibrio sp.]|uniref:Uncharacterized protein n=1 Tax=Nitratidesulfovibrio vulgaris (strain ATCC 29579 / DSM 644 / CCUG 34227 / NCIMB 8303 / VKM B-1760 / Hildenborough) TaxID=882 RepID=Q727N7_NITV2|nr:hypothetical protein DVU_2818 [Nitratidesulfovibrio vulgaris str. Hildenborough]HBW16284.1 hypothetical protein [Desulfovibrio sp.]